jgi:hypothetical protein
MFAGFGTPEDTNQRFKFLLASGQTGLSTAFDMPTLMGYDPEHPRSLGEVGREGVSVASLDDMTRLFGDIPLDQVSTSMTINAPAAVLLALYVASPRSRAWPREAARHAAERHAQGVHRAEGVDQPDPRPHADHPRHAGVVHQADAAVEHDLDQRLSHPRGRGDRRCRSWRSRWPTASATCSSASTPASRSTSSRRGCRSSGTSTTTSSRRSPSSAPPAGCGPRSSASGSAPRTRGRGSCAPTPRPPACR